MQPMPEFAYCVACTMFILYVQGSRGISNLKHLLGRVGIGTRRIRLVNTVPLSSRLSERPISNLILKSSEEIQKINKCGSIIGYFKMEDLHFQIIPV